MYRLINFINNFKDNTIVNVMIENEMIMNYYIFNNSIDLNIIDSSNFKDAEDRDFYIEMIESSYIENVTIQKYDRCLNTLELNVTITVA